MSLPLLLPFVILFFYLLEETVFLFSKYYFIEESYSIKYERIKYLNINSLNNIIIFDVIFR